jgi:hypothetical protein
MKTKYKFFICPKWHPFSAVRMVAVTLWFGVVASFAQTGQYLFTGSMTTITLNPGTYDITAYGAQGGYGGGGEYGATSSGGLGAEMSAEFSFSGLTTLTILVGGSGYGGSSTYSGGGGGGGSFAVEGSTPLVVAGGGGGGGAGNNGSLGLIGTSGGDGGGSGGSGGGGAIQGSGGGGFAGGGGSFFAGGGGSSFISGGNPGAGHSPGAGGGYGGGGGGGFASGGGGGGYSGGGGGGYSNGGGGGSIIDSSAVAIITEVSGVASPDGSPNGEIIITAVPKPITLALAFTAGGQFGFNITGPTNATIVVAACTNLANPVWIPLATNTLSNGTNYFSDAQWTNRPYSFYRVSEP